MSKYTVIAHIVTTVICVYLYFISPIFIYLTYHFIQRNTCFNLLCVLSLWCTVLWILIARFICCTCQKWRNKDVQSINQSMLVLAVKIWYLFGLDGTLIHVQWSEYRSSYNKNFTSNIMNLLTYLVLTKSNFKQSERGNNCNDWNWVSRAYTMKWKVYFTVSSQLTRFLGRQIFSSDICST